MRDPAALLDPFLLPGAKEHIMDSANTSSNVISLILVLGFVIWDVTLLVRFLLV
jgi:hypothetical protein